MNISVRKVITVTQLRKQPAAYFADTPIEVRHKNRAIGYLLGSECFESMISLIRQLQPQETFTGLFQPTTSQLNEVAKESTRLLSTAKPDELGDFRSTDTSTENQNDKKDS